MSACDRDASTGIKPQLRYNGSSVAPEPFEGTRDHLACAGYISNRISRYRFLSSRERQSQYKRGSVCDKYLCFRLWQLCWF